MPPPSFWSNYIQELKLEVITRLLYCSIVTVTEFVLSIKFVCIVFSRYLPGKN